MHVCIVYTAVKQLVGVKKIFLCFARIEVKARSCIIFSASMRGVEVKALSRSSSTRNPSREYHHVRCLQSFVSQARCAWLQYIRRAMLIVCTCVGIISRSNVS